MKPSKNTLLLSICKPVKTGFFICQRLQTVSHWLPNGGFEAFIWKWKIAIPSSPRKWETKAAKPLNRYFSILVYRVYVCTTGEGYFTYSVAVNIVHILYYFLNVYFCTFMVCTKAVNPRMTPHHLMMLTSTMYKHLYIPELIPIFNSDPSYRIRIYFGVYNVNVFWIEYHSFHVFCSFTSTKTY